MPAALTFLFLLLALVCFVAAAIGATAGRINLVAAGLALVTFVAMWGSLDALT